MGRGGGVEGEQEERRKRKEERRASMRVAMDLDMGSILTESDYPLLNEQTSRDVSMREVNLLSNFILRSIFSLPARLCPSLRPFVSSSYPPCQGR